MEKVVELEDEDEPRHRSSTINLTQIVDQEGLDISVTQLTIQKSHIIQTSIYANREPDTQRGGEYLGNQHAEVEQTFKDSVSISCT